VTRVAAALHEIEASAASITARAHAEPALH